MSIDHVSKALRLGCEVAGTDRMVLLVLAEATNQETNECWPSTATVAARSGLTQEKYVRKATANLIALGLIAVDPNGCPDSRIPANRRPNLYRMVGQMAVQPGGARRAPSEDLGGARRAAQGGRDALFEPHIEPEVKPARERDDPSFVAFWEAYPKREAKPSARRAWKAAIRRTTPEQIIEGAKRYARERRGSDPKFTAYPATWLNDDRWSRDDRGTAQADEQGIPQYDEPVIVER